ncbi:MAG: GAF domain-containing protein [Candidatus Krumholzibacteria bacterium]|nr:GAF domain-containing protein [Candidatus Krumholzibacteria bacterium]
MNSKEDKKPSYVSIPQIRLIELIVIFFIVYVAGEIAGFSYNAKWIVAVFLGSAFLNLLLAGMENRSSGMRDIKPGPHCFWCWMTVFMDLATALALVYFTGNIQSPFIFILIVPLFFAGRLLPALKAGMVVTGAAIFTVASLGILEINGIIPQYSCTPGSVVLARNSNYLAGGILVLGGFMGLMTYLFSTFYNNFNVYFKTAEDRLMNTRKRIIELTRLYDISLGINSVISLDTLLKMVCKEITLLLRRPWASVILLNQKKEIVNFVELGEKGVVSVTATDDIVNDPLLKEVLSLEKGMTIEDVTRNEYSSRSIIVSGKDLSTLLAVPVISGRDSAGVLFVGDQEDIPFANEDIRLLTILSGQIATAIEKSRLYEVMNSRIGRLEQENERLESSNKLKMGYISHLSHEFKTPLTSIKAYVESLKDHIDDPDFTEKQEFLGVVSNETDRLIRMVTKVLDVSKIEFGQRTLKRNIFDLTGVIEDVDSSLQPYLLDKRLHLIVRCADDLPRIDGDEDLIKQVFINLIGNAVKFSPQGSKIFIDAVEDAVSVKVTIRDEGVGIPRDDLNNIFKHFYQVKSGMSDGVGLGLAIVKNIIEQHGGYIQVSSIMGEGSTFTFTLPKEHHFNDLIGFIFGAKDSRNEINEIFKLSVKIVAELFSAKIVSLMLLDQQKGDLFIKDAYGLDEEIVETTRVKVGKSIAGKVAQTGEPLLIENIEEVGLSGNPNNPQYETKSLLSVPIIVGMSVIGVINVNNKTSGKPFNDDDLLLLTSISQRLSKIIERMRTAENFASFVDEAIHSLRSLLHVCENDRTGLSRKSVRWAVKVGRKLMLTEKDIQVIQFVSSIHDVGMTTVSEDILKKTLDLTADEVDEIRKHPQRGTAILRPLEFVEYVSQIMLFHHERMDGKGYPMGLKGDQIPVGAKILSVLDAYVSMISKRPFRRQFAVEESIEELLANVDTQFDPAVVSAFVEVLMDEGYIDIDEYSAISERLRFGGKHKAMP